MIVLAYMCTKGGDTMLTLWLATLSLVLLLLLFGGVFIYFVRNGLHSEDSTRIDPLPDEKEASMSLSTHD